MSQAREIAMQEGINHLQDGNPILKAALIMLKSRLLTAPFFSGAYRLSHGDSVHKRDNHNNDRFCFNF